MSTRTQTVDREEPMKRIVIAASGLVCALTLAQPSPAQDPSSVVGVWKMKTIERKILTSGTVEKHYGDNPSGFFVCTKDGNMAILGFAEGRRPVTPGKMADAERAELFNTMYAGYGRCSVEDSKLVLSYRTSW